MSIYIKGIKLPKEKIVCLLVNPDGQAFVKSESGQEEKYQLMPVPDHGDLIDRDGLRELLKVSCIEDNRVYAAVAKMPAIIPDDAPVIYYPQVSWYYTAPHLRWPRWL